MRYARPLVAAAAAIVLLPAGAQAKELASARACDADGCRTITNASTLRGMEGGAPATAPTKRAPFHRIRMTVKVPGGEDFRYTIAYVPSAGLSRYRGEGGVAEWLRPTARARRGFEKLTRGLEPLPARRLRGVGVVAEEPVAQVDEVVLPPAPADDGGGFPWTVLLIPGGLALAAVAFRVTKPRLGRTAAHRALARDDLP